jgi:hypothetical protein
MVKLLVCEYNNNAGDDCTHDAAYKHKPGDYAIAGNGRGDCTKGNENVVGTDECAKSPHVTDDGTDTGADECSYAAHENSNTKDASRIIKYTNNGTDDGTDDETDYAEAKSGTEKISEYREDVAPDDATDKGTDDTPDKGSDNTPDEANANSHENKNQQNYP